MKRTVVWMMVLILAAFLVRSLFCEPAEERTFSGDGAGLYAGMEERDEIRRQQWENGRMADGIPLP